MSVFKDDTLEASVIFLGYGELSKNLDVLAGQYKNIFLHGAVKHEMVTQIASSADIGLCLIQNVSLSDYYCLPNKLFEYCFSGLPVLASNFPDISKTVSTYELGLCCDLDKDSIKQSILALANSNQKFNCNKETIQQLSWQAQEKKLHELYKPLLGL